MESVLVSLTFHLPSISVEWGEIMHIPVMAAFWERSWEERKVRKISLEEEKKRKKVKKIHAVCG